MHLQTGTISKSEALQQIINWDFFRSQPGFIEDLFFNAGFNCFQIASDFGKEQFGEKAHAYFGIQIVQGSEPVTYRLNLLLIPKEQDTLANPDPYIYRAPYLTGNLEARSEGKKLGENQEHLLAMEERWANEGRTWLATVIQQEEGLTQVSEVPHHDLAALFDFQHDLFVYPGLREGGSPQKALALLFYDGNSGHFIDLQGADFTTPKPPFGTDKADYGLLADIPE